MENKGKITISLGTAICIFIIVLLIIALVGVICYNSNKGKNEIINNKLEDNIIDKNIEKNNLKNNSEITSSKEKKTIQKEGKVSASEIKKAKENALSYTFLPERASNCIVSEDKFSNDKKSVTLELWGILKFDKKIKEVCDFWLGQGNLDFVVILFEDGSLKYETDNTTEPKDININPEGKIVELYPMEITSIEEEENNKIEVREGTIAGIDEYGNLYDLQLYR